MSDIDIKETIEDKGTWFNIKRINVAGLHENFSIKTIDLNNIKKDMVDQYVALKDKDFIFEKSKIIRSIDSINGILKQNNDAEIKNFFGWKRWLDDKFMIGTITFMFNPYNHVKKLEDINGFFNYFYEFSKRFVFVPSIRKSKIPFNPKNPTENREVEIISVEDYIKFVNEVFEFFSHKNKKQIFVPVSIRFSMEEIDKLINHYMKKECFYYWIDFEGKPISEVQTAKVKRINQLIEKLGYFDKTLSFFTNVRREIISKRKEEKSPASDILGTIYGANLIGINREPPKPGILTNQPPKEDIFEHKAREFDDSTYYYLKTKNKDFLTKSANITNNAIKLSKEFEKQKQHFLDKLEVEKYLRTKEMINRFGNGRILIDIQKSNKAMRQLRLV